MENVIFDGRKISQRRYQNRIFPNRVHKEIIFRKMSKNGGERVRGGGCTYLWFRRVPWGSVGLCRQIRGMAAPMAYTFGISKVPLNPTRLMAQWAGGLVSPMSTGKKRKESIRI